MTIRYILGKARYLCLGKFFAKEKDPIPCTPLQSK